MRASSLSDRLAHDGHELPLVDLEGHPVQGPDLALLALVVDLIEVSNIYEHGGTPYQLLPMSVTV